MSQVVRLLESRSHSVSCLAQAQPGESQEEPQLADRDNAELAWTETDYVFTMDDGRATHLQSVSRAFDRAIVAAERIAGLVLSGH